MRFRRRFRKSFGRHRGRRGRHSFHSRRRGRAGRSRMRIGFRM